MGANEALLIIDYTNDFVATNGALTTGKVGQAIEPALIKAANRELREGGWVMLVATFTEHGQEWALSHFKNALGATIE